jgi:hypothetical protein
METALYYTFSTIAQALAGTVAFLAAVVLFKLQGIDSEIREHAEYALSISGREVAPTGHYANARWPDLVAAIAVRVKERSPELAGLQDYLDRINVLVQARLQLVSALRVSVPLTLAIMIGAVGTLALVPILKCSSWLSIPALAIGAVAFGACVATYWKVIAALWRA